MSHKMLRSDFSTTKDPRVLQTRKAIRDALMELLRSESIDKISIREVVSTAGVGYNTFFRHYPDKDSILEEIAAEEINHLVRLSISVMDAKNSLASCHTICTYVEENKPVWKNLLRGGAAMALRQEFLRISREVAESRPRGKDWIPFDIAVILITSGIFELLVWWVGEKDPLPVDQVARICQQGIVSPIIDP